MPDQKFRVNNLAGMRLRTEPVVSEATKGVLLPNGQLVTKLGDTEKPDWWHVSTNFQGQDLEGFSNKNLMVAVSDAGAAPSSGSVADLIAKTLAALGHLAPQARDNYLQAIRDGGPLFEQNGITTGLRMAHFMAQAMVETQQFTRLRENMNYSVEGLLKTFGVHKHSAKVTPEEAATLAHHPEEIAERVYGLGNPTKVQDLGNTQPGDGFRYRGNGVLQTTGRKAHKLMGQRCGVDFEGNPDLVTLPENALKPALQEWSDGNLNAAADANNIERITRVINGGLNGFDDRKTFFAKLRPLLT